MTSGIILGIFFCVFQDNPETISPQNSRYALVLFLKKMPKRMRLHLQGETYKEAIRKTWGTYIFSDL
ncbi:hypothetical protein BLX87_06515 [Bacillus sp. VT-16-64]|nr:hypothetical protein BLX87_06515 [Bacillus sp. VT-16-64]